MNWELLILALHAGATLMMAGLIWFVQIVHYPLFARVGAQGFPAYAALHQRFTTKVVGPLMLVEAATAAWLALRPPDTAPVGLPTLGLALVAFLWISTAAVQVPCHRQLERGFDAAVGRRLVRTNWLRTGAWTARGVIAILLVLPVGSIA